MFVTPEQTQMQLKDIIEDDTFLLFHARAILATSSLCIRNPLCLYSYGQICDNLVWRDTIKDAMSNVVKGNFLAIGGKWNSDHTVIPHPVPIYFKCENIPKGAAHPVVSILDEACKINKLGLQVLNSYILIKSIQIVG